jgi:hypothetical protein
MTRQNKNRLTCTECDFEGEFEEVNDVVGDQVREVGWMCPMCEHVLWQHDLEETDYEDED